MVSVPTEVRLDAVTPELSVFPVKVPAAAVTVTFAVPSKLVPFIVLAVARAVAVAAFQEVSWSPDVLTPGKFIFAVPSKDTPPIFLAVSSAVAVAAFPVVS